MSGKIYTPTVKPTSKSEGCSGATQLFWSRPVDIIANTKGDGFWSNSKRAVTHSKMILCCWVRDDDDDYGWYELRVFFPKKSWNVYKRGLIYTDSLWIKEFHAGLISMGFSKKAAKNCDFSEQGMQGDNYVSLDAGPAFAKEFFEILY